MAKRKEPNKIATDNHENTSSESFAITVEDTTAPSLTVPDDLTVEATGPEGAAVELVDLGHRPRGRSRHPGLHTGLGEHVRPRRARGHLHSHGRRRQRPGEDVGGHGARHHRPLARRTGPGHRRGHRPGRRTGRLPREPPGTRWTTTSTSAATRCPTRVFALGTTTVTCTATDSSGNSRSRTFTVTVRDTTGPTLDAPGPRPSPRPPPRAPRSVDGHRRRRGLRRRSRWAAPRRAAARSRPAPPPSPAPRRTRPATPQPAPSP